MCGKLEKAMYGTRDAAQNWEYEYSQFLMNLGFSRGRASPCVFMHKERHVRLVVHGDDFTALGREKDLDWLKEAMSAKYAVERHRSGPDGSTSTKDLVSTDHDRLRKKSTRTNVRICSQARRL